MDELPEPPDTYRAFLQRFPHLVEAWRLRAEVGREGPLDAQTAWPLGRGPAPFTASTPSDTASPGSDPPPGSWSP
jgi:hypothetical protein